MSTLAANLRCPFWEVFTSWPNIRALSEISADYRPKRWKTSSCESREAERKFPTCLSRGAGSREPFDFTRAPPLPGEMKAVCFAPSDQTLAQQHWWLALGKTAPLTAAVLKRAIFKETKDVQHCVEAARKAGNGYTCYLWGTGCLPTVSASPRLSSSSWEILPKALHTPSSIGTARGDALISVAFPHSAVAGSCPPALVRSAYPPPALLPPSTNLPCWKSFPYLHFWSAFLPPLLDPLRAVPVLGSCPLLTKMFQSWCTSPTGCFKCKAMSEMGVFCCSVPQHGPHGCKTAEALNNQKQADIRVATEPHAPTANSW